jgi:protein-S-isoprenylcysteine O-methyltransferase Ste14
MSKPLVSDELWTVIAPLIPAEPPKPRGRRPRVPDRAALPGILADRLLPALLFGTMGIASCSGTLSVAGQSPADPSLLAGLARVLDAAHSILTFVFCGLIATLFLIRRVPHASRARPPAMTVALAGTCVMSAAVIQPITTQDWRVLVLADSLLTAGLAFSIYAAASLRHCFGVAAEARGVVTSGAYRLVRHPLYLGEFIAALGVLLPVLAPLTTLIFGVFCLCQVTRAMLEERVLAATFPEYIAYRRRTPALLPWPRPRSW